VKVVVALPLTLTVAGFANTPVYDVALDSLKKNASE
jgi:hypothetical protein